jgi:hypothetical protein
MMVIDTPFVSLLAIEDGSSRHLQNEWSQLKVD